MKKIILFTVTILLQTTFAIGQQCVVCDQPATGVDASIIGTNNTAAGAGSIAIGGNSHTLETALNSIAIGTMVKTVAGLSVVIGCGANSQNMLVNSNQRTLMIGFGSSKPTFFVGRSPAYNKTGRIGIGNITNPLAKLHIKADDGEEAAVFIEPNTWTENSNATLLLGNIFHGLTANNEYGLVFSTQQNYIFNNGNIGIGTQTPEEKLHVNGTILTNGFKMPQPGINDGYVLTTDRNGNSAWLPTQSLWELGENNNIYYLRGNVGIGTNNPYEKLQVGELFTFHSGGTKFIGYNVYWDGVDNGDTDGTGDKRIVDDEVSCIRFGSNGNLSFWTAPSGDPASPIEYNKPMIITNNGNVGIGTESPDEKLHVNGKVVIGGQNLIRPEGYNLYVEEGIITAKVKVELVSNWSDFVFDKNYKLRSIGDLEKFIKKNKHLPDIPSAKDVKENGIDLGEMDAKLLQKMEELTLYIIQQQKEIEYLKSQIEELKK